MVRRDARVEEAIRLACLYELQILDAAAEEPFDRLTRFAAETTGLPVACINPRCRAGLAQVDGRHGPDRFEA